MNGNLRPTGDLLNEFAHLQQHLSERFGLSRLPHNIREQGRGSFPAINVGRSRDAIEIMAFAPGLDPAEIEVNIDRGLLIVTGRRVTSPSAEGSSTSVYAHERFEGSFRRVVTLPDDADGNQVDASYRDGVVRITIAKSEASKPRRISVN
ncbi:MAG: Hsp20/alpha crystallin family protein [Burkholderiaceae bacterium]|jgi:HSP20 family protein